MTPDLWDKIPDTKVQDFYIHQWCEVHGLYFSPVVCRIAFFGKGHDGLYRAIIEYPNTSSMTVVNLTDLTKIPNDEAMLMTLEFFDSFPA